MFKETKNNEDGSFKETKENLVLLNISLFPIIKKSTPFDKTSITKHDVIFHCREKECKCSFYISKEDLKATIFLCPKGHNICSKV